MADERTFALSMAVQIGPHLAGPSGPTGPSVVGVAGEFFRFLAETGKLAATISIDRTTVGPFANLTRNGVTVAIAVAATVDNNTVTIQVLPEDDHGDVTPDQLSWTNDDTASAFATFSLSADTHTGTFTLTHAEGTINVTIADPSESGLAPAEVQIVIGPGATSQLAATATVA